MAAAFQHFGAWTAPICNLTALHPFCTPLSTASAVHPPATPPSLRSPAISTPSPPSPSSSPPSPARNSFTDILRAILLSLEVLIEDPELQINGFILIIDWSNFSFKQASKLTPSILKLAIEGLQDSFPARFGGVHFVNQPWYIHALYTLIKPFLKDKTRKRIFLHGNNLNSLHQLIHPEFLPSEFGGTLPPYDMGTWARTLLGPDYSDENDYTHTSYNAMHVKHTCSNLERECSPKPMKRSQSVVEAGTLKHEEKGENENTQPLLALD
ncbi:clavesin-1 isoform X2 [Meriones unguiculatus]|uniref:clavesin-1 isoform X2 n=1 Tax=Meriones unguiculatus TaxID=10047 RepID=UPI00293F4D04|nr:clavesin-1 isoform X2 [Meriones unguiculatus]